MAAIGFSANGTAGPYSVIAGFSSTFALPTATFSLTNLKAATSTAVTSSLNPSVFGQSVTFTATVTSGVWCAEQGRCSLDGWAGRAGRAG